MLYGMSKSNLFTNWRKSIDRENLVQIVRNLLSYVEREQTRTKETKHA